MLPLDVQEMLKGNSIRIVFDNAKSHGSRIKRRLAEKPKSNRRMSEPLVSTNSATTTPRPTPATCNRSRWDSAPSPSPSLPKKTRGIMRDDHAPLLKYSPASPSSSQTTCTSLCNVSKPVRRISGEKTILSLSLSFKDINNSTSQNKGLTTVELITKALDEQGHLFDEDGGDDDDVDTVLSAPARLVTGLLTSA